MTFEEEFPSLKGRVWDVGEYHPERRIGISTIEEHCLDKARVKEAIDKIKKDWNVASECSVADCDREPALFQALEEELGLK